MQFVPGNATNARAAPPRRYGANRAANGRFRETGGPPARAPEAAPRRERGGRRKLAARASAFPRPPFKGAGDAAAPLRGAPAPSKMGGAPRGRREAFRESERA